VDLGRVGVWTAALDPLPMGAARQRAAELDELGYGAIWLPDTVGRDPTVAAALLLDATDRISAATGIASIYGRDPLAMRAAWETLSEAFPGRFLLGLGVSHAPMVEGIRGQQYGPPVPAMRSYLDHLDDAIYLGARADTPPERVLAALGPRMLELSAERASGALTYLVPVEHTHRAREVLGPDALLAVEQAVVLLMGTDEARRTGREHLATYLGLPNYTNNLRRLGFVDDDFVDGGSDRLVDALVAWGDPDAIRARVQAHLDAGASHVCIQVLTAPQFRDCIEEWRELAPAVLG